MEFIIMMRVVTRDALQCTVDKSKPVSLSTHGESGENNSGYLGSVGKYRVRTTVRRVRNNLLEASVAT